MKETSQIESLRPARIKFETIAECPYCGKDNYVNHLLGYNTFICNYCNKIFYYYI